MEVKGTISKETISRLAKDVSHIIKNPLTENGIYYLHDEDNMLKGYALILGPIGTPYYGGYYLFELDFPYNYPFSPPTLKFLTNNQGIRFNPNLYTSGKVCVSILNTWHGDPWSSCQCFSSVLLTLSTILNEKPLMNEPGITEGHPEILKYNQIIAFSNISIAMCDVIQNKICCPWLSKFRPIIEEHFLKNVDTVLKGIDNMNESDTNIMVTVHFYKLAILLDYKTLREKVIQARQSII